jgi:hypothetical protein
MTKKPENVPMGKARKKVDKITGKITIITPRGSKLFFDNEKKFQEYYRDLMRRFGR